MQREKLPFIPELLAPLHADKIVWRRLRPRRGEIGLAGGVCLNFDAFRVTALETAYADFQSFLSAAGIPAFQHAGATRVEGGQFAVRLQSGAVSGRESYRIAVDDAGCVITAEECEGVRRALILLEDEIQRCGAPVLPHGVITRQPFLKTRMHLGHIALMRANAATTGNGVDLLDSMPDEYLNRIAHDGANAIWTMPRWLGYDGRLVPYNARAMAGFTAAARRMVERYARYGLKVYLYGLIPEALPAGDPLLKKHPELRGHTLFNRVNFCTSSAIGRKLLEQAMERLFRDIPGLGGFVDICVGERPTHCYSGSAYDNNCPRCSKREPWQVLADTLAAMARGMQRASPDAELIAWPYMQNVCWGERLTVDAAGRMPLGVILQHNFENGGHAVQLSKLRRADDYWLSYTGPANLFEQCARAARRAGTPIFAKAMVAGSHELASVPCIPAPGLVYRKITAMRKLGVSGLFANWGSSNDPSVMQRAAGDLAFKPAPGSEREFLLRHARRDWGEHAATVVRAWQWFAKAYQNYPLTIGFSYYGPMHNGVVWELNLIPRNLHLPRSWMPDLPIGDRIGDCTGYHTLTEIITLCSRMRDGWSKGVRLLESLVPVFKGNRARMQDIMLAQALELHFISGVNILNFYRLREKLTWKVNAGRRGAVKSAAGGRVLVEMQSLVESEIETSQRMLPLVKAWPRLGYTPEAGIYKYNPVLLRQRMRALRKLIKTEFSTVAQRIRTGRPVFPEYTGACYSKPQDGDDRKMAQLPEDAMAVGYAVRVQGGCAHNPMFVNWADTGHPIVFAGACARETGRSTVWQAACDEQALYFNFICYEPRMHQLAMNGRDREGFSSDDRIWINIETSQFAPMQRFMVNPRGARDFLMTRGMNVNPPLVFAEPYQYRHQNIFFQWTVKTSLLKNAWRAAVRIPFPSLGLKTMPAYPLWINVGRDAGLAPARELSAWVNVPPDSRRAAFGRLLPADHA